MSLNISFGSPANTQSDQTNQTNQSDKSDKSDQTPQTNIPPNQPRKGFSFGLKTPAAKPVEETSKPVNTFGMDLSKIDMAAMGAPAKEPEPDLSALMPTTVQKSDELYTYPDQVVNYDHDMATLQNQLNIIRESFDDPSLPDNTLYVMEFLTKNPEAEKLMLPADIGLMVSALQKSYGVITAKKSVGKEKRASSAAKQDEIANLMADMNFGALLG